MNVVLLEEHEVVSGAVILDDERARHIVKVLHADEGQNIKIGILHGSKGTGQVLGIRKKYPFWVKLQVELESEAPAKTPIDLLLAFPRPIMLRRILSQAAALGYEYIHVVNARRVEKSYWQSGLIERKEYLPHLIHGLEQAGDTVPPEVKYHRRFKIFMEDYLPQIQSDYSHMLFGDPDAQQYLGTVLDQNIERVLVAIGPEGGWVDYEREVFCQYGFTGFSIGERILKVDTAVVNIHGRIMAEIDREQ